MTSARSITWSLVADIVLVVVFAVIGRASHSEDVLPIGILTTAWPFLLGLVIGWGVTLAWRAPTAPVRTGIPVWLITVAIGMPALPDRAGHRPRVRHRRSRVPADHPGRLAHRGRGHPSGPASGHAHRIGSRSGIGPACPRGIREVDERHRSRNPRRL
ncbi:DUF3054 domain-containing protein [Microbacterium elymi]|uniref:DUF3054 domain-containing protein n=1 Tax=Microbacterium elymi TaxID=2909587 RepID=UPI003F49A5C8